MENLIGVRHEETLLVNDDVSISFLGHDGARVLGTPWMIMWMERVSRNAVKPLLPEGWDTVGTVVNVRHLSAAPMGSRVTFRTEVIGQTPKRLLFRVEAEGVHGMVGDGTHERAVIDVERFAAGLAKRTQS